jgi:hypothetical protein
MKYYFAERKKDVEGDHKVICEDLQDLKRNECVCVHMSAFLCGWQDGSRNSNFNIAINPHILPFWLATQTETHLLCAACHNKRMHSI